VDDGHIAEEPNIHVLKAEILHRHWLCGALEKLLLIEPCSRTRDALEIVGQHGVIPGRIRIQKRASIAGIEFPDHINGLLLSRCEPVECNGFV
jgi:hypothetical protein